MARENTLTAGTLTTGPAAKHVGIGEQTLRDWARSGRIPYLVTPSGRLLFRIDDLDNMIRRVEPKDAA